jgi:hypothetical protein
MLKVSSIWINACMDMSDHGLFHPYKGPGVVVNSLTSIKNEFVKCLFLSIGAEYTKIFKSHHR